MRKRTGLGIQKLLRNVRVNVTYNYITPNLYFRNREGWRLLGSFSVIAFDLLALREDFQKRKAEKPILREKMYNIFSLTRLN